MNAIAQTQKTETADIIKLPVNKRQKPSAKPSRFKVQEYENPRTGSTSWRVTGTKRDGTRVRENFSFSEAAQCRQIEFETEYLRGEAETTIRATKLSAEQVQLAEVAFIKLGDDWQRILDAVDHWKKGGKQVADSESPNIDDAVEKFNEWLDGCTLRDHSKKGLRLRVGAFAASAGRLHVNEITIDGVERFLSSLEGVTETTRDNYKRAISRFFSWCIERPRRWATANPCNEIRIDKGEKQPPSVLTVAQCKSLLKAAEPVGLAPYISVCLFAGLRPFEAARLDWKAVNLNDREIRLEAQQTKTGRSRVVTICDTLAAWLRAHKGEKFLPQNWRRKLDAIKEASGLVKRETQKSNRTITKIKKGKPVKSHYYWKKVVSVAWVPDVMRHTAISHYFRKTGSYGQTAEQFGNSESIIKAHYQGRVSSDETKKFYALRPSKKSA